MKSTTSKLKLICAFPMRAMFALLTAIFVLAIGARADNIYHYKYTRGVQTYTVPAGVTSISVDAYGASGTGTGGLGGRVQSTISVSEGQRLNIYVGGVGVDGPNAVGGWNGGGGRHSNHGSSISAGGGATDIRLENTSLNDRILVAGGGGGGYGSKRGGHGGGLVGGKGEGYGATGGSQSAGGRPHQGGNDSYRFGTFGIGAHGASNNYASGSGGGGWYGGGSGDPFLLNGISWASGAETGGGGSSYTDSELSSSVVHTQGVKNGHGELIITVNAPVITVTSGTDTVGQGSTWVDAGATADGGEAVIVSGAVDTNTVGAYAITYTAGDESGNGEAGSATRIVNVVDTTLSSASFYDDISGGSIVATISSTPLGSDNYVSYDGYIYRTLLDADVNGNGKSTSAEQTYTTMPAGYSVAPDDQDIVDNVIAPYKWDVWRLCTESKAWGTLHYEAYNNTAGGLKNSTKMWEKNGGDYRIISGSSYYRLLIRAPEIATTYTLVSGTGDSDNQSFTINGNQLKINDSPNYATQPSYSIRIHVADTGGVSYERSFTLTVKSTDTTAPVITVTPGFDMVESGSSWTDAGASADTGEVVTASGAVDTSAAGTYMITYTATDGAGNVGTATRTVTVKDTTAPVITVIGGFKITKIRARQPGEVIPALMLENDKDNTWHYVKDASSSGLWDWSDISLVSFKPWAKTYTLGVSEYLTGIEYRLSPSQGGISYLKIYTYDASTESKGINDGTVLTNSAAFGQGSATILEAPPNEHIIGITGSGQKQGSGWNDSVPSVLSITTTKIVINTVGQGATWTDAGATADTGETVTSSGTVDTSVAGTYTITYAVTDAAGNVATPVTRTVTVADTMAPVITMASGTDTVEQGSTWADPGATADTGETVTSSGTVDTSVAGTYTITYAVTDAAGNVATPVTRTVTVADTMAPVITMASGTDTVEQGSTWADAGATADTGETVTASGTVDTSTIGTYTITYTATDAAGNAGTATRTVTVVADTTAPVITVASAAKRLADLVGGSLTDDGNGNYTLVSNIDLTEDLIIGSNETLFINTNIQLNISANVHNKGIVFLTGNTDNQTTINNYGVFVNEGLVQSSNQYEYFYNMSGGKFYNLNPNQRDGVANQLYRFNAQSGSAVFDVKSAFKFGRFNSNDGSYTGDYTGGIPYEVALLDGNTVEQGGTWADPGATADTGETVTSSGTVDTSVVGSYTITYTATDAAGNAGTVTRTVTVVDIAAPVITVISGTDTIEPGVTWADAGATADTGEVVTASGTVDTSTSGTYTITYTATDAAGNVGTATRTITVGDGNFAPVGVDSSVEMSKGLVASGKTLVLDMEFGPWPVKATITLPDESEWRDGDMINLMMSLNRENFKLSSPQFSPELEAYLEENFSFVGDLRMFGDGLFMPGDDEIWIGMLMDFRLTLDGSLSMFIHRFGDGDIDYHDPLLRDLFEDSGFFTFDNRVKVDDRTRLEDATSSITSGSLAATDVDQNSVLAFTLDAPVAGLTLATNGTYTFDGNNQAYADLWQGDSREVVADWTVTDQHGATDSRKLTITVKGTGVNPAPVITVASAAKRLADLVDGSLTDDGNGNYTLVSNIDLTEDLIIESNETLFINTNIQLNISANVHNKGIVFLTKTQEAGNFDNKTTVNNYGIFVNEGLVQSSNYYEYFYNKSGGKFYNLNLNQKDGVANQLYNFTGQSGSAIFDVKSAFKFGRYNYNDGAYTGDYTGGIPYEVAILDGNTVEQGGTWADPGATADTGETVTSSGTVDTSVVGTYTITYTATDGAGNAGTVTRTVTVVDIAAPVITVISGTDTIEPGVTWADAGATADTGEVVTASGTVDTSTSGTYTITYTATDAAGNVGTATRTITVGDGNFAPVGVDSSVEMSKGLVASGKTLVLDMEFGPWPVKATITLPDESEWRDGDMINLMMSLNRENFKLSSPQFSPELEAYLEDDFSFVGDLRMFGDGLFMPGDDEIWIGMLMDFRLTLDGSLSMFIHRFGDGDIDYHDPFLRDLFEDSGFFTFDNRVKVDDRTRLEDATSSITSGSLAATDVDQNSVLAFTLDAPVAGLTLATNGTYTFDGNNQAYADLWQGDSREVVADWTVTDQHGATDSRKLTITVKGTGVNPAPVISVTSGTDTVEQGSTWTDAGATADGGETVTASGAVDTSAAGTYTITYTATDGAGNVGTATRTVTVEDTTAPVITVTIGTDTVDQGATWTDAGATADGGETVTASGAVDTSAAGTYTITYTATDGAGNVGTATRTVTVEDTTAPVITVTIGTDTVDQGATWTDAGATADGGETVIVSGTVNTSAAGTYTITYTATDGAGNTGTATRTVTVEDTTPPVISVTAGNDTVERGGSWTDAGATTTEGSISFTGTVNTDAVGTYTITYSATDSSNNTTTATRTVTVVSSDGGDNFGDVVIYPNNSTTLTGQVKIEGEFAESGDVLAIYVGNELRGKQEVIIVGGVAWVNVLVNAAGGNETISFKVYDASTGVTHEKSKTSAVITTGGDVGSFASPLMIEMKDFETQTLSLKEGWNLVSFYVEGDDMSPATVLGPIQDKLLQIKNLTQTYDPTLSANFAFLNNLSSLSGKDGYWLKVSEDVSLDVEGAVPSGASITVKSGWNLVGYPRLIGENVASELTSLDPTVVQIKNLESLYDPSNPSFLNTLSTMVPGSGYWLNVTQDGTWKLGDGGPNFGLFKTRSNHFPEQKVGPVWGKPVISPNLGATVLAKVSIQGKPVAMGSVVGVFVGNELRGLQDVVLNEGMSYVTLNVNLNEAEEVSYRVWNSDDNNEYLVSGTMQLELGEMYGNPELVELNAVEVVNKPLQVFNVTTEPFGFSFNTMAGRNYTVEATGDLRTWEAVEQFQGSGREIRFTAKPTSSGKSQFFRVLVE